MIVTPEYNSGFPAPLKNALDFLHAEWRDKALGVVTYGGGAGGGAGAAAMLAPVTRALGMVTAEHARRDPTGRGADRRRGVRQHHPAGRRPGPHAGRLAQLDTDAGPARAARWRGALTASDRTSAECDGRLGR